MIIIIGGSSHVGKTYISQQLMERTGYPYISLDHLKMGFIRTGMTELTVEDDYEMTFFLWPYVAEIIKTAIENNQNMIIEGCYVPANWRDSFDEEYQKSIRAYFIVMTKDYIERHYDDIVGYADVIENRPVEELDKDRLIRCSLAKKEDAIASDAKVIEIADRYDVTSIVEYICTDIAEKKCYKKGDMMYNEKEFSIDGLEAMGKGGTGECYRVDEDKILKLYYEGMPREMAYREKDCSRTALIIGVPTPISYDVVKVGERRGVIYEILNAKTMSQAIAQNPDKLREYARIYADIAKSLHNVKGDVERFGRSTYIFRDVIDQWDFLDDKAILKVREYLEYLDTFDRYVHGDFQPNNVMIDDKNVMLIDMGGFSVGNPIIDIATSYFTFFASPDVFESDYSGFTGLNVECHRAVWENFIAQYYQVNSYEEAKEKYEELKDIDDIVLLLQMRFIVILPEACQKQYIEAVKNKAIERWSR
ncbi:MAG: phosphotransferase [Lachnospiraceae bacterium]|nr:phosphotransferase [Candidatus Colinaster equi]